MFCKKKKKNSGGPFTYHVHKVGLRVAARLVEFVRRDVHHGRDVTVVGTARTTGDHIVRIVLQFKCKLKVVMGNFLLFMGTKTERNETRSLEWILLVNYWVFHKKVNYSLQAFNP